MKKSERKIISTPKGEVILRRAEDADIHPISELTRQENLLFRSPEDVEILLPCYHVAENAETGEIIGCISAKMFGHDAEIISFRVRQDFAGIGIGTELLAIELEFLKERESVKRIFSLTTRKVFEGSFSKAGFVEVGIQMFDPKVIQVCSRCPKNVFVDGKHKCDEIAVMYPLP